MACSPRGWRQVILCDKRGGRHAIDAVNVVLDAAGLVFEAPRSALHAIGYQVRPDELDYARVVIAISGVVIESGEAMLMTGFFSCWPTAF